MGAAAEPRPPQPRRRPATAGARTSAPAQPSTRRRSASCALVPGDRRDGLAALPLDAHALAHSRGPASRFADVRILDEREPADPVSARAPQTSRSRVDLAPSRRRRRRSSALARGDGSRRPIGLCDRRCRSRACRRRRSCSRPRSRVFERRVQVGVERDRPIATARAVVRGTGVGAVWRHADERTSPRRPSRSRLATIDDDRAAAGRRRRRQRAAADHEGAAAAAVVSPALLSHRRRVSCGSLYGRDDSAPPRTTWRCWRRR